jgi:hypothetical protein
MTVLLLKRASASRPPGDWNDDEYVALIDRLATHHDRPPSLKASGKRNHDSVDINEAFFNRIDPQRSSAEFKSRSPATPAASCVIL